MMRLLTSLLIGLLCAAVFLGISVAADGTGTFHWLRDIFIGPPLWVLQTGLPAVSPWFEIEPGSPYGRLAFFVLFFVTFWCLICGAAAFAFRRQSSNNSFKGMPLRGTP